MESYVFVYGTLKQGFRNHHLLEHCVLVGKGQTKERYALYVDGTDTIPYVSKEEEVSSIQGEIYLVDKDTLHRLDQLEQHPEWYYREEIAVILAPDGEMVSAWIYFNDNPLGELIESGAYSLSS